VCLGVVEYCEIFVADLLRVGVHADAVFVHAEVCAVDLRVGGLNFDQVFVLCDLVRAGLDFVAVWQYEGHVLHYCPAQEVVLVDVGLLGDLRGVIGVLDLFEVLTVVVLELVGGGLLVLDSHLLAQVYLIVTLRGLLVRHHPLVGRHDELVVHDEHELLEFLVHLEFDRVNVASGARHQVFHPEVIEGPLDKDLLEFTRLVDLVYFEQLELLFFLLRHLHHLLFRSVLLNRRFKACIILNVFDSPIIVLVFVWFCSICFG